MNIVKFEGKAIEKLITVISKGIGEIYRPIGIKREADAKAYEIEVIGRANAKAKTESLQIEIDSNERIQDRLKFQEQKRQRNIDSTTRVALDQLMENIFVSDEPVDEDWITRFFNIVQDISEAEMQNIWGKILAGEIIKPKSFSLRTLEVLRNITKEEAVLFNKLSSYAINCSSDSFILKGNHGAIEILDNIKYADILLLSEVGLMQSGSLISYEFLKEDVEDDIVLTCGSNALKFEKNASFPSFSIQLSIYSFTSAGSELLRLINAEPSKEYLDFVVKSMIRNGITVKHAKILENKGEKISHTPFVDYE